MSEHVGIFLKHTLFGRTCCGDRTCGVYVNSVQMVFVVCLEEERLTLADCWSEQFKIQGINLVKILQGSQGPSDAPEDWWQRLQREHSIREREREREGGGRRGRQFQRYSHYSDLPKKKKKKQHMGNLSFHNMKGFYPTKQNKLQDKDKGRK